MIPAELAVEKMKAAALKSYGAKGQDVVDKNYAAIDRGGEYQQLTVKPEWANFHDLTLSSRLGIAQASLALLSLLRPFLLGEVLCKQGEQVRARYLSVKKAYPNEAEELHSRP